MEIIRQYSDSTEGNDCILKDEIVILHVHGKFVVLIIRRYTGWADNGLDFRSRKEFDDIDDANRYFDQLKERSAMR